MNYPKQKKDRLFELIKSLTKSEKRYFKLMASLQNGDKNYLKLFDAIESSEKYDEEIIKKRFAKEKFIRNLREAKKYLYEMIFKTLRNHGKAKKSHDELLLLMFNARILFNRSLFDQCNKILKKIKALALDIGQYDYLSLALELEESIMNKTGLAELSRERAEEIFLVRIDALKKNVNTVAYSKLRTQMTFLQANYGVVRNESQKKVYDNVISTELLQDESKAITPYSKQLFHETLMAYSVGVGDFQNAYKHSLAELALVKNRNRYIVDNPDSYIGVVANVCIASLNAHKYGECLVQINELRTFCEKLSVKISISRRASILALCHFLELNANFLSGRFEVIPSLLSQSETFLKKYRYTLREIRKLELMYYLSYYFFAFRDYKNALKWLNNLFSLTLNNNHLYYKARLLELMVHYKLGNEDMLPYITKSVYRHLLKNNILYKSEKSILDFIRLELPKVTNSKQLLKAFEILYNTLQRVTKDKYELAFFNDFDFISWLEGEIKKKSFIEIVKEKYSSGKKGIF
jgi:hypothetical protein